MRKPIRLLCVFLLTAILLSACSLPFIRDGKLAFSAPTPTPTASPTRPPSPTSAAPTGELAACVAGAWELNDVTGFETRLHAAWLNLPEAWEDYQQVSVTRSSGGLVMTFDGNGLVTGTGSDYQVDARVSLAGITLNLGVIVDGAGHADYQVDETMKTISFTNPAADDMLVSVKINNVTLIDEASANDMALLKKIQRNGIGLRFACAEDALRIEIETTEAESMPQSITLKRVKP